MIDTNVKGTIYTIRAALPHLLGERREPTSSRSRRRRGVAAFRWRRSTARRSSRSRIHARPGPRAPAAGHPVRERVPRRCGDRVRDGPGSNARDAGARRNDVRGGRRRCGAVRAHASSEPSDPGDGIPARDGGFLGMSADVLRWGVLSTAKIGTDKVIPASGPPSARCEVVAIASRVWAARRLAAAELDIVARVRLLRGPAGRPGRRRRLYPAAEPPARRVDDRRGSSRQARAVREAPATTSRTRADDRGLRRRGACC